MYDPYTHPNENVHAKLQNHLTAKCSTYFIEPQGSRQYFRFLSNAIFHWLLHHYPLPDSFDLSDCNFSISPEPFPFPDTQVLGPSKALFLVLFLVILSCFMTHQSHSLTYLLMIPDSKFPAPDSIYLFWLCWTVCSVHKVLFFSSFYYKTARNVRNPTLYLANPCTSVKVQTAHDILNYALLSACRRLCLYSLIVITLVITIAHW